MDYVTQPVSMFVCLKTRWLILSELVLVCARVCAC